MRSEKYLALARHYESCLARHGDTHRGVDWPNKAEAEKRYQVMLEVVRDSEGVSLLDFGCGAGHFLDFIGKKEVHGLHYTGMDISPQFVDLCRKKHKGVEFRCLDILKTDMQFPDFDYIVANGVFTEKRELTFDEMWLFVRQALLRLWPHVRCGLAFNVMSKNVEWERNDLFHVPLDLLSKFIVSELSRNFVFRSDYGLYEVTAYVYR